MLRITVYVFGIIFLCCLIWVFLSTQTSETIQLSSDLASEGTKEEPLARKKYEWLRLCDPQTNTIPKNIRSAELEFINKMSYQTQREQIIADEDWKARGPYYVGGRTKALALDLQNENIILAGCVSSGMYKSTDGGMSWNKTTAADQLHSVTCLAQNTSPGREHIWYYGTGEYIPGGRGGSAAGPGGTDAFYRGDGIFKSVDGGDTWSQLSSTISGTAEESDPFDYIWNVATFGDSGVYAATSSGLFKSTDDGESWERFLDFGPDYPSTEIAVTSTGIFYATRGGNGSDNGIYRSVDGESWENISPEDWPDTTSRTVIGLSPSNENVIYFFTEVTYFEQQLRKYEDGVGWTELTQYLPLNAEMQTYGGNMLIIYVKPDDEDTIFLGTIALYRSTDGGESYEVISTGSNFHVDQHSIVFYPSDPNAMIVGNDGGLFRTTDNMASGQAAVTWESLNNGYLTTQFYTVSIDHATTGSETISGGMQDNGCMFTTSSDLQDSWDVLAGGDGGFTMISDSGKYHYTAQAASFGLYRHSFPGGEHQMTEITPLGGSMGLWLTIFMLDPFDQKIMYVPSQTDLWRNSDLTEIPHVIPRTPTDVNWSRLENVSNHYIHALGMSKAEPRRLYYSGTRMGGFTYDERMYYIDNPHEGQPEPVEVTGENFPSYPYTPYITCIAVDPNDANKVIVVFPNYRVISIYASEDGGSSWIPVSGNLEENPDGSGSGPSVRWVSILYVQGEPVYFAGTSCGLFSTTQLNGMETIWTQEGATTIGNVVIDMIDVRQSDGFVVIGTHGNGVYSTYITKLPVHIEATADHNAQYKLFQAYPNPFNSTTKIAFTLPRANYTTLKIFDTLGREVSTLVSRELNQGNHTYTLEGINLASGIYYYQLAAGDFRAVKKIILLR